MPSLEKLHIRKNKISSFEEFPELPALTYLNARENNISKLDSLKKVVNNVKILNLLANPLSE
jgi:Leucine-rich repeat (LRR) protein